MVLEMNERRGNDDYEWVMEFEDGNELEVTDKVKR
jgi:hypothetical protein